MPARNPLEGLTVVTAKDVGPHSRLQLLAFALQRRGIPAEEFRQALGLTNGEVVALAYDRKATARPIQLAPKSFRRWLCMGGRGAGKTWSGSNWVLDELQADPNARILLIAPTLRSLKDTMLEGPSGLLTLAPPWFPLQHQPSRNRIVAPNGAQCFYVPAEAGRKRLLGLTFTAAWCDEVVAWKDGLEVYEEVCKVTRHKTPRMVTDKRSARIVITSTPEPSELFKRILEDRDGLVVTRMTSFENAAHLDGKTVQFYRRLLSTGLGRQEHLGELTFDQLNTNTFARVDWQGLRLHPDHAPGSFERIIIGYDPTQGGVSGRVDEAGIVAVGIQQGPDGLPHTYLLDDRSLKTVDPQQAAQAVVDCYRHWLPYAQKIHVLVETNKGGSTHTAILKMLERSIRVEEVLAREPKTTRAQTLATLAEAGLVHLAGNPGSFRGFIGQAEAFTGADNQPDGRIDAASWVTFRYVFPSSKLRGALGERPDQANQVD